MAFMFKWVFSSGMSYLFWLFYKWADSEGGLFLAIGAACLLSTSLVQIQENAAERKEFVRMMMRRG